jgi:hypothetical protein
VGHAGLVAQKGRETTLLLGVVGRERFHCNKFKTDIKAFKSISAVEKKTNKHPNMALMNTTMGQKTTRTS